MQYEALAGVRPREGPNGDIEKAREALEAQERFVTWQDADDETELRATMNWPGDDRRRADLNVFFVHTPE